ncbi:MAG: hypothetical protein IRZ03_13845, partial [Acidobacterium ailaaui]|nr:hypothetical protein [Pseudacidobacterium ailaaui]
KALLAACLVLLAHFRLKALLAACLVLLAHFRLKALLAACLVLLAHFRLKALLAACLVLLAHWDNLKLGAKKFKAFIFSFVMNFKCNVLLHLHGSLFRSEDPMGDWFYWTGRSSACFVFKKPMEDL